MRNLSLGIIAAVILLLPTFMLAQKSNKIKDQGITGPLHQKYVGKIVFSKSVIKKEETNEASFVKEFSIKEDIFFRVYMKESIYNALCDSGYSTSYLDRDSEFYISIELDSETPFGRDLYLRNLMSPDEKKQYTTFQGCFKKEEDEIGAIDWKQFIENKQQSLTPGKHIIKIRLSVRGRNDKADYKGILVATGEFTLNIPANFIDPNDPSICLPKANKKDAVLEAKMMVAVKKTIKDLGWKNEPTKIILKSTDWNIIKNEYTGRILKRSMEAFVASKIEGKCAYELYTFYQDYTGSGYQDKTYTGSAPLETENIHCDCLKAK